jgi:hypothetical protein
MEGLSAAPIGGKGMPPFFIRLPRTLTLGSRPRPGEELAGWLWEGMRLWHCPQNHEENVFIYKMMRQEQAILLV